MRIAVVVNASHEPLGYGAGRMSGPPVAEHAYRWREIRSSVIDETALILLGPWQMIGDALEPVPRANAAPTAAQTISIRVTADASRIAPVLNSIDLEVLAASLLR